MLQRLLALTLALLLAVPPIVRAEEPAEIDLDTTLALLELLLEADEDSAAETLRVLQQRAAQGQFTEKQVEELRGGLKATLDKLLTGGEHAALHREAVCLAAVLGRADGLAAARGLARSNEQPALARSRALAAIIAARDAEAASVAEEILGLTGEASRELREETLSLLAGLDSPRVPKLVLARFAALEPELRPRALELLTQRPAWSQELLSEIAAGKLSKDALNANQVARLQAAGDEAIRARVTEMWGAIRAERNPDREGVVAATAPPPRTAPRNFARGEAAFHRVCGQCHTIHGRGQQVGPDITGNGRGSFEQLLSNVLDPSLVIGGDYQARTLFTAEGRVLTGLLAEDSPAQIVLKTQGGKLETIPRDDIDEVQVSQLSLMPEGIEKQLEPQELADLFHYLAWDRPPSDPEAKWLPGTPAGLMGE